MKHTYIIIDDYQTSVLKTKAIADSFQNLEFLAFANNYDDGLDIILEYNPNIIFLEIDPLDKASNLSLQLINELYRYLKEIPKVIITTKNKELAFDAIKYEIFDYFTKPVQKSDFRKTLLKFEKTTNLPQFFNQPNLIELKPEVEEKSTVDDVLAITGFVEVMPDVEEEIIEKEEVIEKDPVVIAKTDHDLPEATKTVKEEKPLIICVKSYGDYRFIEAKDICYLQADNNSTDIHLYNGEMITAFKTLKHFEGVLSSPFVRIHNSYIVNIDYVSRIHTGNAVCYIKNTTTKLPFSKSYKENVDSIISSITNGNYLEI